ncbi:DUF4190 domain-containing protein [Streptomyces turgidiscabies]|uniref:DUF4190 domain-containing protein n=2 Tax=Streptomyces TaxID=1883 RepID=L7FG04_STRT8|nr:DUF4190 domain-containing protein [Streptomyces turgidiscabies]ELP69600.1 hypothetical protein STRTUCAR8_07911 [Streptomyces turgidiscabies Car8]MDX3496941.1 DUF4190 domain-containing protein [Streptomyces turgidiscabies]GAQ76260.1 hypothetical protein T45_08052 [Streptomyces turgidiscabies]
MSDAAQPSQSPENVPEGASSEGAATGETVSDSPASGTPARVPLDKPPAGAAPGGRTEAEPEFDPWAPPADDSPRSGSVPDGPGGTVFWNNGDATPPPPAVHNHPTVTSTPTGAPPAPQASQPWANPFAPPGAPAAGTPQDNPFAPPAPHASYAQPAAPGEPVPPPPIAPGGPGQVPYAYPPYPSGPGYGYPQQAGYGGPGPGYPAPPMYGGGPGYGWAPMGPQPMNGLGTASLVVGIASAVLFCLWPLAIILGILAVVFGLISRGRARRGQATNPGQALAGIICGGVAIVLAVAFGVLIIAFGDEGSADDVDGSFSTSLSQQL